MEDSKGKQEDNPIAHVLAFYPTVNRSSLDTRADSRLFHMRQFNNWCKAVQILELNPRSGNEGLRVLDLACGKGGDLRKWTRHQRGIQRYVGVDVVLPSLEEAAKRSRAMRRNLKNCTFVCADLGNDSLGQDKNLPSWSLSHEPFQEKGRPSFRKVRGGGIRVGEKFDVISIQFAVHYMFGSKSRARRFFKTIGELLEVGGSFIATTIDARVVINHLMDFGIDFSKGNGSEDDGGKADKVRSQTDESGADLRIGDGACRLKFQSDTLKRIFQQCEKNNLSELFGLEYLFQLVEGSDQAAGAGEAVNVPEYLVPLPVLRALADEAGLEMDYIENFHEFFHRRCGGSRGSSSTKTRLLHDMKVTNRNGSLSQQEWDICRLYCAFKFTRRSKQPRKNTGSAADKKLPQALIKAKRSAGEAWATLPYAKKQRLIAAELEKM